MTTISTTRTATADETAREMDRRGEVIERLEADISAAAAEITRLRAENAGMREALSAIVSALAEQDDEGLIEFAPEMQRARAALSNSSQAEGQKP